MTTYYLDTSALSKRYVAELGTEWLRTIVDPEAGHTLLTARITMVEIYSALARRQREGTVSRTDGQIAAQAFTVHSITDYDFVELDLNIVKAAHLLLNQHPLRAYDAVQLASALKVQEALTTAQLSPLVFLSADNRLNAVAIAAGMLVDNPNQHS
ncbi:MAG: type II toxin-antitoxin system VapC family toxin [Chloroflexi bacterium]|nr:type II toxin-antitoxin system VapC family toxin [Chloroflexota bacterium]